MSEDKRFCQADGCHNLGTDMISYRLKIGITLTEIALCKKHREELVEKFKEYKEEE